MTERTPRPRYPSDSKPRARKPVDRVTIILPADLRARLEDLAADRAVPVAEVVRDAVTWWLERQA